MVCISSGSPGKGETYWVTGKNCSMCAIKQQRRSERDCKTCVSLADYARPVSQLKITEMFLTALLFSRLRTVQIVYVSNGDCLLSHHIAHIVRAVAHRAHALILLVVAVLSARVNAAYDTHWLVRVLVTCTLWKQRDIKIPRDSMFSTSNLWTDRTQILYINDIKSSCPIKLWTTVISPNEILKLYLFKAD